LGAFVGVSVTTVAWPSTVLVMYLTEGSVLDEEEEVGVDEVDSSLVVGDSVVGVGEGDSLEGEDEGGADDEVGRELAELLEMGGLDVDEGGAAVDDGLWTAEVGRDTDEVEDAPPPGFTMSLMSDSIRPWRSTTAPWRRCHDAGWRLRWRWCHAGSAATRAGSAARAASEARRIVKRKRGRVKEVGEVVVQGRRGQPTTRSRQVEIEDERGWSRRRVQPKGCGWVVRGGPERDGDGGPRGLSTRRVDKAGGKE
jgi:hypothetical protein